MSSVLVVAETRRGELREVTAEAVAAGLEVKRASGARLIVAVLAANPEPMVASLGYEGVDEIVTVAIANEHFEPHVAEAALESLIEAMRPIVVVVGHTADSLGFAASVAARGEHGFASDVSRVGWDDGLLAWRGVYGGKLEAELEFAGKQTTIILTRIGAFSPAAATDTEPPVREVAAPVAGPRSSHRGFEEAKADGVDITTADFLVSIGRGVNDESKVAEFERLAESLGAVLSGSRPLIDAGWIARSRGVGQSGKTVTPDVYLAFGISGAGQHLAGIRGAKTIVAVNTDPEAPIFSVADYGAVADLFEVSAAMGRVVGCER